MHALIQAGEVVAYPYTDWQLRQDNPNTSFPSAMDDTVRAGFGMYPVTATPVPAGKRAIGTTAGYVEGELVEIHTLEDIPLAELKAEKLAALAQRRWEAETGGVTVEGAVIRTDATSQAKITGAVSLFQADQTLTSMDWEAQPGVYVEVDAADMTAIGIAVGRHVQACFSHARSFAEAINAAQDFATLDSIDIHSGWPS
ncbi:DUF4376 domain-containing protein [Chelatococcus sp. YT9]|uniref:DUF4376 domain-containing protein n=1 Tax=Chelatococcus sp. YT9 TaxID=2835635 RepID=UPI001BCBAE53|nr:DUF4376 domain-containing protein [Chelatococcus sp. YT9]MBS7698612.1 DUF4376 domain-containing protein [Chelatococcus sp. YT9]